MNKRPVIKLIPSPADKAIQALGWGLLALLWGVSVYAYISMPDIVPTHFNAKGEVNATGNKSTIWIIPIIASVTYLMLTLLNRYPHLFNYTVQITEENAEYQYTMATRLLRVVNLTVVIVFLIIVSLIYAIAHGIMEDTGVFVIILVTLLPIMPVVWYFIKLKRKPKQ